jgi:L-alanine-DL-glutamate epimerase-like enolase superfamily enzyme
MNSALPTLMAPTPSAKMAPLKLERIETWIYSAEVKKPVVSTLASITKRVALLIRVEDSDGAFGWGEVYSTLPSFGATHRAQIVHQLLSPRLRQLVLTEPTQAWRLLTIALQAMVIQTGEPGPIAAAISGLDVALWDLFARKAGLPLVQYLGGTARPLRVYASGLNPADGPEVVEISRSKGYTGFKQKIGFDAESDLSNLCRITQEMVPGECLMVDVNQGWRLEEALAMAAKLSVFNLKWIEEPLMANAPSEHWRACARAFSAPLAGGENLRAGDFARHSEWLSFIQPDVGKWGGISANGSIAQALQATPAQYGQHKTYCPHWLGSGIGLMASAHLLSATSSDGLLEVDVNENPLREILCLPFPDLKDGHLHLSQQPGLGVHPDLDGAKPWLINQEETRL